MRINFNVTRLTRPISELPIAHIESLRSTDSATASADSKMLLEWKQPFWFPKEINTCQKTVIFMSTDAGHTFVLNSAVKCAGVVQATWYLRGAAL